MSESGRGSTTTVECAKCGTALNDMPADQFCPSCGSGERHYRVHLTDTLRVASSIDLEVSYPLNRSWAEQWADVQASYAALQHAYTSGERIDNHELRRLIKNFFTQCWHMWDWLLHDPTTPVTETLLQAFCNGNGPLSLCNAMANTTKHHTRTGGTTARVKSVKLGSSVSALIEHSNPPGQVDALHLATDCMIQWRQFLAANNIVAPS